MREWVGKGYPRGGGRWEWGFWDGDLWLYREWDCQVGMEWRCEDVVIRNRTKDGTATRNKEALKRPDICG